MLYEVITPFLALNITALPPDLPGEISSEILRGGAEKAVITSYSIHYTKLYDTSTRPSVARYATHVSVSKCQNIRFPLSMGPFGQPRSLAVGRR